MEQEVINAVKLLKKGEHKTTAIKVELEANLDRYDDCYEVHQNILARLESLGLSENISGEWKPKKPLVFAKVYNDLSVDTELTFTLMLNKASNILLLPKIIQIFRDVCEDSGEYFEIDRAGMHIALLNNATGRYPARAKAGDPARFKNFRKSMIRLLPALYFLGSHDETSRSLDYRQPQISSSAVPSGGRYNPENQKYSAVAYREGAVEFRVFETCYENPDAILDMVCVISNAMKFWTTEYTRNNLKKYKSVRFGIDGGHQLSRMFVMAEHIDLLNAGLNILKPKYYTLKQLKKQRNFTITKASLNTKMKEIRLTAVKNYAEYEKRYSWERIYMEQDYVRLLASRYSLSQGYDKAPEDIEGELAKMTKEAKDHVAKELHKKKTLQKHVAEEIEKAVPNKGGRWVLDDGDDEQPAPIPPIQVRQSAQVFFEEVASMTWATEAPEGGF